MSTPDPGQFVEDQPVSVLGGRRFWIYRADPPPGEGEGDELFKAVFRELDARHQEDRSGPVGLCVAVSDPEVMRRRPEATWPDTELTYAGTLADRSQLRIRYFAEAVIAPGLPNSPSQAAWAAQDHALDEGYRIVPLAETDAAGADDVVELWTRENAMPQQEARRRVHEVLMVGLEPSDQVAAVSTVYLQRNAQLGMDLWHYRTYVSTENRMANFAIRLLWATRDHLRERYESGVDPRAPGMLMEVESEFLQAYYNTGYWALSDFWFIGESSNGAHVRVHYFPGAQAPIPQ